MASELLDTNIMVYAYDRTDQAKHAIARNILISAWRDGGTTTVQKLSEFYVVITKKVRNPIPAQDAAAIIRDIIDSSKWKVFDRDQYCLVKAVDLSIKTNVHLWDALIAQTMIDNGLSRIITENESDFKRIPGIEPDNPFKN